MAKKKKKPASNPERGFATSSVASKSKRELVDDEQAERKHLVVAKGDGAASDTGTGPGKPTEPTPGTTDLRNMTPEELEEELERNDLQLFVETHGPKVCREAQRQISRIQTDNRVLRAQSQLLNISPWLTDELVDDIIVATKRNQEETSATEAPRKISEETWVSRLWFLHQVLQGIGISKDDSLFALERLQLKENSSDTSSIAWGIRECFEILALECNRVQIPPYSGLRALAEVSNLVAAPPTLSGVESPATARSQSQTPSISGASTPLRIEVTEDFEVSDYDSDIAPEELVDLYVASKSRLFAIDPELADPTLSQKLRKQQSGHATPMSGGVRKLTHRLQQIVSDILFNKDDADRKWAAQRIKLTRERALQRVADSQVKAHGSETNLWTNEPPTVATLQDDSSSSSSEDGILGDMFLAPGETSAAGTSDGSGSVTLRSFGKASGFIPRRLLEDACRLR
jgi:ATP-dependent RNA helicase DHX29